MKMNRITTKAIAPEITIRWVGFQNGNFQVWMGTSRMLSYRKGHWTGGGETL